MNKNCKNQEVISPSVIAERASGVRRLGGKMAKPLPPPTEDTFNASEVTSLLRDPFSPISSRKGIRKRVQDGKIKNYKFGFTLAEVLITLAIVGVVAALTLPNLIVSYKDRETVVKVKKVYSSLSNAYLLAKGKYGSLSEWEGLSGGTGSIDDASLVLKKLGENMTLLKNCEKDASCFNQVSGFVQYKNLGGTDERFYSGATNFASMILADGTLVAAFVSYSSANSCSVAFIVDINGTKSPNVVGKDAFWFSLRPYVKDMVLPGSSWSDVNTTVTRCLYPDSEYDTSRGCTIWVIYKENLDYLHCTGLSWNGKSKCD